MNNQRHQQVKKMRLDDGTCLNTQEQIHNAVVQYFKHLLKAGSSRPIPNLEGLVQAIILEGK